MEQRAVPAMPAINFNHPVYLIDFRAITMLWKIVSPLFMHTQFKLTVLYALKLNLSYPLKRYHNISHIEGRQYNFILMTYESS